MLRTGTVEPPTPTPVTMVDPSLFPGEGLVAQLEGIPVRQRVVLVLHQDHFAGELATFLATQPRSLYRDVGIQFSPGTVEVQGRISVLGLWVPVTVWGNLYAQDCHAKVTITDLSVGGLVTPAVVREEARKLIHGQLDTALDDLFKNLPLCLDSIEVLDGIAILEGIKQL